MGPKNPKFEYAYLLGKLYPSLVKDEATGAERLDDVHETYREFETEEYKKIDDWGITADYFNKQEAIIPVLEGYGLDKEKFRYAVAYVYYLTSTWIYQKGVKNLPSSVEQLTKVRDEIRFRNKISILIDEGYRSHTIPVEGYYAISHLYLALDHQIEFLKKYEKLNFKEVSYWANDQYKLTEATWYAATMFKKLLDELNLPIKRSRRNSGITYDKNQLIAELIHFLELSENTDLDGLSIKQILKEKREFEIGIY